MLCSAFIPIFHILHFAECFANSQLTNQNIQDFPHLHLEDSDWEEEIESDAPVQTVKQTRCNRNVPFAIQRSRVFQRILR